MVPSDRNRRPVPSETGKSPRAGDGGQLGEAAARARAARARAARRRGRGRRGGAGAGGAAARARAARRCWVTTRPGCGGPGAPDLAHQTVTCGHFMAEEAPAEVVRALHALLAR
ncbi:hypothetical protein [Micromonospora sp. NPDC050695]|uniref:hypothetical protein n=1 Tax=Micromonospora sp. NPDC050695 TaxID=3154938 RepID=UPI0033CE08E7